jgi:hypothetical protein
MIKRQRSAGPDEWPAGTFVRGEVGFHFAKRPGVQMIG